MTQPSATEFLETIRSLLTKHRSEWKKIAYLANVSEQWMGLVISNKARNPGYATLLRTYKVLCEIEAE